MQDKIVLVAGAGFSVPAKLPMQSDILKEMSRQPVPYSVLDFDGNPDESKKFLHSFITASIYLLDKYAGSHHHSLYDEYQSIVQSYTSESMVNDAQNDDNSSEMIDNEYYKKLVVMKERIRERLEKANLAVSLEDVFTSFDKTITAGEYMEGYSHNRLESIKQSIMRLFIYYFSKRLLQYDFKSRDYSAFMRFIKAHISQLSIITTNWDTLLETYFDKNKIQYNLCLNEPYFKFDDRRKNPTPKKGVKLIKVHGSANWFSCLNCGMLSIIEKSAKPGYLFDDGSEEECPVCRFRPPHNEVLL